MSSILRKKMPLFYIKYNISSLARWRAYRCLRLAYASTSPCFPSPCPPVPPEPIVLAILLSATLTRGMQRIPRGSKISSQTTSPFAIGRLTSRAPLRSCRPMRISGNASLAYRSRLSHCTCRTRHRRCAQRFWCTRQHRRSKLST